MRYIGKYLLMGAVQLVFLRFAVSANPSVAPETVRTQRLQIVDPAGKVRAELGVLPARAGERPDVVVLRMRDSHGKDWLTLCAGEESGSLELGSFGKGFIRLSSNYPHQGPRSTVLEMDRTNTVDGAGFIQLDVNDVQTRIDGLSGYAGNNFELRAPSNPIHTDMPDLTLTHGQSDANLGPMGLLLRHGTRTVEQWPTAKTPAK